MACHADPAFTPAQEARVREIVAQMIGQTLKGADLRLREVTPEVLASRQRIIDAAPGASESLCAIAADLALAPLERALGNCSEHEQPAGTVPYNQRGGLR